MLRKCKLCGVQVRSNERHCSIQCRILANVVVDENGCWIWQLSFNPHGYPSISVQNKTRRGNRVSYEAFNGPIPDGLVVRHTCHNRACLNPAHLVVGTHRENTMDAVVRGSLYQPDKRGSKHHGAKLTEKQVLAIRADPRPHKEIAKEYGVYWNTIYRIRARFDWKHI